MFANFDVDQIKKQLDEEDIQDEIEARGGDIKVKPNTALGLRFKQEYTKDFKHSGVSYSKRRQFVVVENNSINKNLIKPVVNSSQSSSQFYPMSRLHLISANQTSRISTADQSAVPKLDLHKV